MSGGRLRLGIGVSHKPDDGGRARARHGPAPRGHARVRDGAPRRAHRQGAAPGRALPGQLAERPAAGARRAADPAGRAGPAHAGAGRRDRRRRRAVAGRARLRAGAGGARHPPRTRARGQAAPGLRDRGRGAGRAHRRSRGRHRALPHRADALPRAAVLPGHARAERLRRGDRGLRPGAEAGGGARAAGGRAGRHRRLPRPSRPSSNRYREAGVTLPAVRPIGFPDATHYEPTVEAGATA